MIYKGAKQLFIFLTLLPIFSASGQDTLFQRFFYPSGELSSEGIMIDGKPQGNWKAFYKNGVLRSEGTRKNENAYGIWKFYTNTGDLEKEISYKAGKKNGAEYVYKQGNLSEVCYYSDNVLNGSCTQFNREGKQIAKKYYSDGIYDGFSFSFGKDDLVKEWANFKDGQLLWKYWINNYNGEGKKEGKWVTFYPNENKHWEEFYVNGEKFGAFKEYSPEGELLRVVKYGLENENLGEGYAFVDSKIFFNKKGQKWYEGPVNDKNEKHGFFFYYDEEGNIIEGRQYLNNILLSKGETDSLGRKQKEWEYYFPDGTLKAKGIYLNDEENGEWEYLYANGKKEQKGNYAKGKAVGEWIWYHDNGQLWRLENYTDGLENGKCEEFNRYGTLIAKGKYKLGLKHGKWEYYINDIIEIGNYKAGLREGIWNHFNDEENLLFQGSFQDGVPDGTHEYFYANGKTKIKGTYFGGEKKGDWEYYSEEGTKINVINYKIGGNPDVVNGSKLPKE